MTDTGISIKNVLTTETEIRLSHPDLEHSHRPYDDIYDVDDKYNCEHQPTNPYTNGQPARHPVRQEPNMGNGMHLLDHIDSCHQLFPDDNDNESSDICNLSPEVFDFRWRYISSFVFTHVNINSFRPKYPFICDMLNKQSVDLLAIYESKLDNSFTDSQF